MEGRPGTPPNAPLLVLIAANLLPVAGVLFWGWSVFEIVSLYWFENVVIGAVNILKILCVTGEGGAPHQRNLPESLRSAPAPAIVRHGAKLFLIPFFVFHYGMFCLVHGIFVFALLGGRNGNEFDGSPVTGMAAMISEMFATGGGAAAAIAIIGSHLFSFGHHFMGKGEFRRSSPKEVMAAPYGRIVVLHLAIILGAFATAALGSPLFMLLLLIAGKTLLDAKLHLRSHAKSRTTPDA